MCSIYYSYAQENNPYTFKGIPIEGPAEVFLNKLVKQGFRTENFPSTMQGIYKTVLSGIFFNNEVGIMILVDKSNNVTGVGIIFNFIDTYVSTDNRIETYKSIRQGLEAKYTNSKWKIYNTDDFKDMNLNEVRYELTVHGKSYEYCILDDNYGLYIKLGINENSVLLTYFNPITIAGASEQYLNDL